MVEVMVALSAMNRLAGVLVAPIPPTQPVGTGASTGFRFPPAGSATRPLGVSVGTGGGGGPSSAWAAGSPGARVETGTSSSASKRARGRVDFIIDLQRA